LAYPVINEFIDLEHDKVLYKKGETYPKEGFEVDPKRVKFLQSDKNKYKRAFLGPKIEAETVDDREKEDDSKKKESTKKKTSTKK
jgi:hypothetical protein